MFEKWFVAVAASFFISLTTWWITRISTNRSRILELDDPVMMAYVEDDFRHAIATASKGDAVHVMDVWNKGNVPLVNLEFDIIERGNMGGITSAGIVYFAGRAQRPAIDVINGRVQVKHPYIDANQQIRIWAISSSQAPLRLHCASDNVLTRSRRTRRGRRIPFIN